MHTVLGLFILTLLSLFQGSISASSPQPSKKAAAYIRFKRLKQIQSEGGSYKDAVTEGRRYADDDDDDAEAGEDRKRKLVLRYVDDQARIVKELERKSIGFLPDCGVREDARWFYPTLYANLSSVATFPISRYYDMPNIYLDNTKRFGASCFVLCCVVLCCVVLCCVVCELSCSLVLCGVCSLAQPPP